MIINSQSKILEIIGSFGRSGLADSEFEYLLLGFHENRLIENKIDMFSLQNMNRQIIELVNLSLFELIEML